MVGYIGSKAVTLSTTAADVAGDAVIDGNLTVKGTTVTIDSAAVQEIRLGDNDKMTFGDATGGDLQIYHDGSNSYIKDAGTGNLLIQSDANTGFQNAGGTEWKVEATTDGAVNLYYDGAAKLATTSTGIDVTGTVTADGLTVDGHTTLNTSSTLFANLNYSGSNLGKLSTDGVNVNIEATSNLLLKANSATRAKFDGNGDISFYEDTGTTAKFFWDASAESLTVEGFIETSYVSLGSTTNSYQTVTGSSDGNDLTYRAYQNHIFKNTTGASSSTDGTERMRIDANGTVGIGVVPAATWDTFTAVQIEGASVGGYGDNNTILGSNIYHDSPTGYKYIGAAAASVYQQRYGEHRWYGAPSGTADAAVTMTQHMTIDSNGQLGINTATPNNYYAKKLVIDIGSDVQNGMTIVSGTSASGMIAFADGTSGASAYRGYFNYSHSTETLSFGTGGTEAMRLDANGSMALGDTNPTRHGQATKALIYNGSGTAAEAALHCSRGGTSNEFQIAFSNAYGVRGTITTTSGAVSYNTTSDYRLKENVTDVTDGITRVKQLAPKRFNFILDPDTTVDGFLAHEAQAVVPEAVTGTQDAVDAEGNPEYQGIDQSKLVPLLTAALQEAIAKIETLETEMTSVKARLDALEGN
jgi:hypothetical protein